MDWLMPKTQQQPNSQCGFVRREVYGLKNTAYFPRVLGVEFSQKPRQTPDPLPESFRAAEKNVALTNFSSCNRRGPN